MTFERDLSLQSGDEREWSFSLNVGRVAVPSLKTEKSSVRWLVRGVLDRSLRTDPKVEQESRRRLLTVRVQREALSY